VYKPSEPGPWPVVVAFHGGDMIKKRFNVFSKRIAELGAEVLTPTWRSGRPKGEQITTDQITAGWEDAACVLRFARAKAADYVGDLSRVVVVGYSRGGIAGATMALAGEDLMATAWQVGLHPPRTLLLVTMAPATSSSKGHNNLGIQLMASIPIIN